MSSILTPLVKIKVILPPTSALRVQDLDFGTCFLKEHRLWIKQNDGYCMALDNFVRYQLRPAEQVERVIHSIKIEAL